MADKQGMIGNVPEIVPLAYDVFKRIISKRWIERERSTASQRADIRHGSPCMLAIEEDRSSRSCKTRSCAPTDPFRSSHRNPIASWRKSCRSLEPIGTARARRSTSATWDLRVEATFSEDIAPHPNNYVGYLTESLSRSRMAALSLRVPARSIL